VVLVPIVVGTLVYLIAYIASNKLQIRFYAKIIFGLVILLISYLASAIYGLYLLPNINYAFTFGGYFALNFEFFASESRPTATLLYTWQFFDVAYAHFDPREKPVWFWLR
jgi:hypothetical protein